MTSPTNAPASELIDLLNACADDREQEAHDSLAHTPEAFDAFMGDAKMLRAHAASLQARSAPASAVEFPREEIESAAREADRFAVAMSLKRDANIFHDRASSYRAAIAAYDALHQQLDAITRERDAWKAYAKHRDECRHCHITALDRGRRMAPELLPVPRRRAAPRRGAISRGETMSKLLHKDDIGRTAAEANVPFSPGDWVRFYRSGMPVLGVVEYVMWTFDYPSGWRLVTDNGLLRFDEVLESRCAAQSENAKPEQR